MTSNDFKQHNGHYFCYSPNLVPLLANYVTVVEVRPIRSGTVMQRKEPSFQQYVVILLELIEKECIKEWYLHSKVKIWLVQHSTAILAIAELLLFIHFVACLSILYLWHIYSRMLLVGTVALRWRWRRKWWWWWFVMSVYSTSFRSKTNFAWMCITAGIMLSKTRSVHCRTRQRTSRYFHCNMCLMFCLMFKTTQV